MVEQGATHLGTRLALDSVKATASLPKLALSKTNTVVPARADELTPCVVWPT